MYDNKEIEGKLYHTNYDGSLILDENNEPIEAHICLCAAHDSSECCCGAWDIILPGEREWN
jgi:hypothetical protein